MKTMTLLPALLFSNTAVAQDVSEDPIGDARIAISQEADFDGARVLLEAFESHALEASPPVGAGPIAEMNFLIGVLEYYLNQDEEAAKAKAQAAAHAGGATATAQAGGAAATAQAGGAAVAPAGI